MDMALDPGNDHATDLGQRLEAILRRGHLYQNVAASDNSNVHNGDRIYVTYNVTYNTVSSDGSTPAYIDRPNPNATYEDSARSITRLERKRDVDDDDGVARKGVDNNKISLEIALASWGDFSKTTRHVEKGEKARRMASFLSTILEAIQRDENSQVLPEKIKSRLEDLSHQLRRTKCIKVNKSIFFDHIGLWAMENRREDHVSVGTWQISLITCAKETLHPYRNREFSVLYAQLLHGSVGSPLAAFFSETTDADQVTSAHPTVLASKNPHPISCHGVTYEAQMRHRMAHTLSEVAEAFYWSLMVNGAIVSGPGNPEN